MTQTVADTTGISQLRIDGPQLSIESASEISGTVELVRYGESARTTCTGSHAAAFSKGAERWRGAVVMSSMGAPIFGFVMFVMATSLGCARSAPARICPSPSSDGYRVDYSMASKDCTSAAQLELPSFIAVSKNLSLIILSTADAKTVASVNLNGCSVEVQIQTEYTRNTHTLSITGKNFVLHQDGGLRGPAELQLQRLDGSAECSASIEVVLTPWNGSDAGAL